LRPPVTSNYTKELFQTDQRKDFNSKTMDMMTMVMMTTTRRRMKEDQEDWVVNATKQLAVCLVPESSTDSKGNRSIRNNNNEYQKEEFKTNTCMARSNANDFTTGTLKDTKKKDTKIMAKMTPRGNGRIHTAPPYSISTKAVCLVPQRSGSKEKWITQTEEEKERNSTKKQAARKESQDTMTMTKKDTKMIAKTMMTTESTPMKMKFANEPFATLAWWDYYTKELIHQEERRN
jgi:hypothetical protein